MASQVRTILAGELHQLASDLAQHAPGLGEGSEEAATQCLGLCQRLGQVADMIEAPALQELALFLMSNIPGLLGAEARTQAPAQLCVDLQLCLLEGPGSHRWSELATNLADTAWPASMEVDAAHEVAQGLKPLAVESVEPEVSEAPTLTAEELSLCASEDVGVETLQAFFQEAPLQAGQLNQLLARFTDTVTSQDIAAAQRLVHTLKGSSALCGLRAISHLAHAFESRLETLTNSERIPARARQVLIEVGDMLEQLIELAAVGAPVPETLPGLISTLYADDAQDTEVPAVMESNIATTAESGASAESAAVMATITPTLNVATALIDDNLNRAGEINVAIGQLNAHVTGVLERANRLMQQLTLVQSQVYELETIVDTRGTPTLRAQQQPREDFDPLELDEYTALHSLSRAFAESTLDSRELSRDLGDELLKLQNLMAQHARLGRELTNAIMSARLVPVATIVSRLERIVRQTSRQTGHPTELEIHGRELAIDTDILAGLVEPLMHVLRNAVDHGIEPAQERLAAGKDAIGRIRLSFRREGNRIEVRCTDDGRGLDYGSIERRGRERGLFAPAQRPSMAELAALIFLPGFSTRSEVSVISGRGVGMDVVRASVERLKGTTHIESRGGQGCTLTFRLPLSLTAAHVLFVAVGDGVYGFPSTAVDHVLYSDAGRVVPMGEQHAFEYGGRICSLHALGTLLGQPCKMLDDLQAQPQPIVIVSTDTEHVALIVDRALDSRQVIIKGLSPLLPALPGVAGASVLPNGNIGVILEVRELLRQGGAALAVPVYEQAAVVTRPRALVVDDSLSARRAMAQLLTDCGYDVVTAVDGMDAIAHVEQQTPDLVLVDLEMPRMNGLELTAHLRNRDLTRFVPIVMITSRGAEKHRAQALRVGVTDYLTKPYVEQELLDRLYERMPPCRSRP